MRYEVDDRNERIRMFTEDGTEAYNGLYHSSEDRIHVILNDDMINYIEENNLTDEIELGSFDKTMVAIKKSVLKKRTKQPKVVEPPTEKIDPRKDRGFATGLEKDIRSIQKELNSERFCKDRVAKLKKKDPIGRRETDQKKIDEYEKDQKTIEEFEVRLAKHDALKERLKELTELYDNRSEFKEVESEYGHATRSLGTLVENLTNALGNGEREKAHHYWAKIDSAIRFSEKQKEEWMDKYGTRPSDYDYIECDELGNFADPKYEIVCDEDLSPHELEKGMYHDRRAKTYCGFDKFKDIHQQGVGLKAAKLFEEFSQTIRKSGLDHWVVEELPTKFEETAWDLLRCILPPIDNRWNKMTERLGFYGLYNFCSDLIDLRKRYAFNQSGHYGGNALSEIQKDARELYQKRGIQRSEPTASALELERVRKDNPSYTQTYLDMVRLL